MTQARIDQHPEDAQRARLRDEARLVTEFREAWRDHDRLKRDMTQWIREQTSRGRTPKIDEYPDRAAYVQARADLDAIIDKLGRPYA